MTLRIHNFSAGPAVLPVPVLERAQRDLLALPDVGMSVLEISHRSRTFEDILGRANARVRELYGVPGDYAVLWLQGGASTQFSMVPMNFLPPGGRADYILTGSWSEKALKEAQKVGEVRVAASTASTNHDHIPAQDELDLDGGAAYVHYTSNNTIFGTEWSRIPDAGSVPLVCDLSSDLLSQPLDISRFALVYGGIQKNLGPAGATLVILRRDLLDRVPGGLPTMLDYKVMAGNDSLYNTPPVFSIYVAGLVLDWIHDRGGLPAIHATNREKAGLLYQAIDDSGGFYRCHARADSRSLMNVTFRLPSEDLEKDFARESDQAGFSGLKGHRSVGGLRASIYNAFPLEGVERLVTFMETFRKQHG